MAGDDRETFATFAVSSDGRLLAGGSSGFGTRGRMIRLWKLATAKRLDELKPVRDFERRPDSVIWIAFSADGRTLFSGNGDPGSPPGAINKEGKAFSILGMWRAERRPTASRYHSPASKGLDQPSPSRPTTASGRRHTGETDPLDPPGRRLRAPANRRTRAPPIACVFARWHDAPERRPGQRSPGLGRRHGPPAPGTDQAPTSGWRRWPSLLTGAWPLRADRTIGSAFGTWTHPGFARAAGTFWLSSVAVSPDGATAITSAFDDTTRLWDVVTGRQRHVIHIPDRSISNAISPDGQVLAVQPADRRRAPPGRGFGPRAAATGWPHAGCLPLAGVLSRRQPDRRMRWR